MGNLTTKYITKDDYLNYFGEDLDVVLPTLDSPDNKAERFIKQVEDDVEAFLNTKCFKRIDTIYNQLTDYQKECYKKALLNQCKYKLKNGDIGNDSGYDPHTGRSISRSELQGIELSSKCIDWLMLAGLYNRKIGNNGVGGGFFPFFW
jgi:hypothetical protein